MEDEEKIQIGEDLFFQVVNEDIEETQLSDWIDTDLFDCYSSALAAYKRISDDKGIDEVKLSREKKEEFMKKIEEDNSEFFSNPINGLYLKLFNLYEMLKNQEGKENQDLYYIMEHFEPRESSLDDVLVSFGDSYRNFMEFSCSDLFKAVCKAAYSVAISDYKYAEQVGLAQLEALSSGKEETSDNSDTENLDEEDEDYDEEDELEVVRDKCNVFRRTLDLYTYEYAYEILEDNCFEEFVDDVDTSLPVLAALYSDVHGKRLTVNEKNMIANEFAESEIAAMLREVYLVESKVAVNVEGSTK